MIPSTVKSRQLRGLLCRASNRFWGKFFRRPLTYIWRFSHLCHDVLQTQWDKKDFYVRDITAKVVKRVCHFLRSFTVIKVQVTCHGVRPFHGTRITFLLSRRKKVSYIFSARTKLNKDFIITFAEKSLSQTRISFLSARPKKLSYIFRRR